jgi:hypothetical protein
MQNDKMTKPARQFAVRNLKHKFTDAERIEIGSNLGRSVGALRGILGDFDKVKADFKAKITAEESNIDSLSTSLMNGFEMRNLRCEVVFRPADKKKDFYRVTETDDRLFELPDLTDTMTTDDFQAELLQAESMFDHRDEINLFKPTGTDRGLLIVGRFGGKWFSALRVKIGKLELNERLDSEQRAFKTRLDAVRQAVSRVKVWAKENMKDLAKGFEASFDGVVEAHKERVE